MAGKLPSRQLRHWQAQNRSSLLRVPCRESMCRGTFTRQLTITDPPKVARSWRPRSAALSPLVRKAALQSLPPAPPSSASTQPMTVLAGPAFPQQPSSAPEEVDLLQISNRVRSHP